MAISAAAITRKNSGGYMSRRYGAVSQNPSPFGGKTQTEAPTGFEDIVPEMLHRRWHFDFY